MMMMMRTSTFLASAMLAGVAMTACEPVEDVEPVESVATEVTVPVETPSADQGAPGGGIAPTGRKSTLGKARDAADRTIGKAQDRDAELQKQIDDLLSNP